MSRIAPDRTVKCPAYGCERRMDADDLGAQMEHMNEWCREDDAAHLDVMRARLSPREMRKAFGRE